MKIRPIIILLVSTAIMMNSCEKYLDEKPDQRLATIQNLQDMQALLDNSADLNYTDPAMGEACADNFFITDEVFNILLESERNLYTWSPANVFEPSYNPWNSAYVQVNIANTVLQAAAEKQAEIADQPSLSGITGQALFFRAKSFLNLAGVWALPYQSSSSTQLPGIPLKLSPALTAPSYRASIEDTYQRIIRDFKQAASLLPDRSISPSRPSKASAYGMLSRTYLQMRDYEKAGKYADSALRIQSNLLDFNTLTASANFPIPKLNVEVIFEGRFSTHAVTAQSRALVNPDLYSQYGSNDLRKTVFFKASGSNFVFKGSYEAAVTCYNGIATDELLLTRSECQIRSGNVSEGLKDLNLLLKTRFKAGTFIPYENLSSAQALLLVKTERRKELLFRALRWADIRRFNQEGDDIMLKRKINGKEYVLPPGSPLYALAIPEDIVRLSGITQNAR